MFWIKFGTSPFQKKNAKRTESTARALLQSDTESWLSCYAYHRTSSLPCIRPGTTGYILLKKKKSNEKGGIVI